MPKFNPGDRVVAKVTKVRHTGAKIEAGQVYTVANQMDNGVWLKETGNDPGSWFFSDRFKLAKRPARQVGMYQVGLWYLWWDGEKWSHGSGPDDMGRAAWNHKARNEKGDWYWELERDYPDHVERAKFLWSTPPWEEKHKTELKVGMYRVDAWASWFDGKQWSDGYIDERETWKHFVKDGKTVRASGSITERAKAGKATFMWSTPPRREEVGFSTPAKPPFIKPDREGLYEVRWRGDDTGIAFAWWFPGGEQWSYVYNDPEQAKRLLLDPSRRSYLYPASELRAVRFVEGPEVKISATAPVQTAPRPKRSAPAKRRILLIT